MAARVEARVTGRRERNKQQKHDRIVTAARALFYAQGYKKTTTQQIAHAAQVASGTLFLYAKTKEDLLIMVFYEEFIAIIDAIPVRADDARPVEEQVMALFKVLLDYHEHDIDLSRELMKVLTFVPDPDRRDDLREVVYAIEKKLHKIIVNSQEKGVLSEKTCPLNMARILFRVYYHCMLVWLGGYYADGNERDEDLRGMIHGVFCPVYADSDESGATCIAR